MYAVVGCTECRALWVVEDRPETTRCPRCGKRHQFGKLKAFAETETSDAAARVRSSMLANRSEHGEFLDPREIDVDEVGMSEEEFLSASGVDPDAIVGAERGASGGTGGPRSRKQIVLDAFEELDEPTAEAIRAYASEADVPESYVDRALEKLQRAGTVTETGGVYRKL
jgi:hypothetical protein